MPHLEQEQIQSIREKIEELRNKLHQLTIHNQGHHFNDEIVHLSQDLDKFICAYHRAKIEEELG